MPQFLINARDKANALELRMKHRPQHLEWAQGHADKILMAGPVFADDGETFAGSTFVVEFDTLDAAEQWHALDPYVRAGLFHSVEIVPFRWLLGEGKPKP